jgi:hypothetical protein
MTARNYADVVANRKPKQIDLVNVQQKKPKKNNILADIQQKKQQKTQQQKQLEKIIDKLLKQIDLHQQSKRTPAQKSIDQFIKKTTK